MICPATQSPPPESLATSAAPAAPAVRVLHVINGEDYAGAERVQDQLALRLPDFGYEVGFACLKPARFSQARAAQQAPLFDLAMRSRLDVRPVARLARLIRREGYAVVHTHTPRAVLVGGPAAALAGVPLVHHVHSQPAVEVGQRWLVRVNMLVERLSLARAAGVIAVSESLGRHLRARGYARRRPLWLVPNGVPALGPLQLRPHLRGEWTFGVLALFRPRKGIDVLLEALAQLRAAGLPVRLRAVGRFQSPDYEREIHQLADRLGLAGAIDWIGFRQDVAAELQQMDAFILPSVLSEAMPMSILEAMAAGTLVVGTRVEGITDLIRDGETGLLAAPDDANDLARLLSRLVRREVDDTPIRRAAHRCHAERYSDHSMAAGVAAVYREILT